MILMNRITNINMKPRRRVSDSTLAEWYLTPDRVFEFAENGRLELVIPSGVNTNTFVKEVYDYLIECLSDPELANYYGEVPKINYIIKGTKVYFSVAK